MDAATLERIFDPYFTTKKVGEGTGLGLATVHGIVEGCKGGLKVESVPGAGTGFEIYFPLADQVASREHPELGEEALPAGSERLLLVDDEPLITIQAKLGLEKLGYRVVACTSSREALDEFRAAPDSFDAVITDQTMPNMTGMELAQELLLIRPGVSIILCTGFSELVDETSAKAAGIQKYLKKPVLQRALAAAVREIMDSKSPD